MSVLNAAQQKLAREIAERLYRPEAALLIAEFLLHIGKFDTPEDSYSALIGAELRDITAAMSVLHFFSDGEQANNLLMLAFGIFLGQKKRLQ
jgi:hypothetical protein